ncbi:MAG TPA: hypothetical protein DFH97_08485, partial [Clostridiales bacterium]|nr:hypothetical protein [Clostridiales bacterium]
MKTWLKQLYNHQQALAYEKQVSDAVRVAQARDARLQAEETLNQMETQCASLPPRMETEEKVRELRAFRDQWNAIREEEREAPAQPQKPEMPNPFTGLTAE